MAATPASTETQLRISTRREELDVDLIHGFLSSEAYWSRGIPRGTVERAIAGSLGFGTPALPQSLMEILRPDIYRSAAADIPALQ